ncbi:2064_t:CDS:1, partial [Scutellospora calospora]
DLSSLEFEHDDTLLNSDNIPQTTADMKEDIPKYTVERIRYENLPKKGYIYQLEPISSDTSTDSDETNDINVDSTNDEVDASLVIVPFRRIGFGGRFYGLRRGLFYRRRYWPYGIYGGFIGRRYYRICYPTALGMFICGYAFI